MGTIQTAISSGTSFWQLLMEVIGDKILKDLPEDNANLEKKRIK